MASQQGGGGGIPAPKPVVDPLEELKALIAQSSQRRPVGSVQDYMAQAQSAYAPSFGYLDQASANARSQAGDATKKVGGLYAALANDINAQSGGIAKSYQGGINEASKAYQDAIMASNNQFNDTNNNAAKVLERLGIQEAAPNVLNKSNHARNLLAAMMQSNSAATQNNLREGQQAALTFNRETGVGAKFAGAEAQSGIQRQLMGILGGLDAKRAELGSQVNQYGMSLHDNAAKMAMGANPTDMFDMLYKVKSMEEKMAKDRANYEIQSSRLTGNHDKLDPLGQVQNLAGSLYNNPVAANNAFEVVSSAASQADAGSDGVLSLAELVNKIKQNVASGNGGKGPTDIDKLYRLAALYLQQTKN